ncbi:zinc finger CCCH domain-containing protein 55-like [Prosopis cineraria]|uniref:zinc finger CCCH domain-containing protein 55-like n=1 Tax=Prosopis cineraria TaxID=364024 RepID=UPI00241013EC|nr:zinc finger CCCH domain-containing protein 55-like [Prosopis cineraria]
MDSSEATNIVLTKIKNLDPENASKIMGVLLISLEDSDLVRLCCSPDHVLHSLILRVKTQLRLSSNSSTSFAIPSPPSPLNPIARPTASNPFSQSSPRIGDNGFDFSRNPSSPSSHSWVFSGLPNSPISPNSSTLLSYKNIRAGFPNDPTNTVKDFVDEHQMNDYLSFLNESSSKNEDLVDPCLQSGLGVNNWQSVSNGDVVPFHRRCFSASDVCFEPEEAGPGIGHKLCLYYARGHCKNGNNCKFVHGILPDSLDAPIVGSPSRFEGFEQREEVMRLKAIQQRMMASSRLTTGVSPSSHDQYLNFLMQQQSDPQSQRAAAALMMGEDFIPFGRGRPERNDFSAVVSAERLNSASRQIYLTFPAESTFKDEDVSDYFSQFGPVQDVRIPYQQKRMFGFVTFVYPETVRQILAKGNPHFICDSRVLVKPYKEKGKVPEKRQQHQQQQFDRGDFPPSLSPMGFDSKEPYDHLGARMLYSPQEILFRRQLEEHELQKAIELQGRRLMNLQLPDFKNNPIHHHHRSLSVGSSLPLPQLHSNVSNAVLPPDSIKEDIAGYSGSHAPTISLPTVASLAEMQQKQEEVNPASIDDNVGGSKMDNTNTVSDKNLAQVLPDSLSASPTNAAGDLSDSSALHEVNESAAVTASTSHNLEPLAKSADVSSH